MNIEKTEEMIRLIIKNAENHKKIFGVRASALNAYVLELLERLKERVDCDKITNKTLLKKAVLNGARDFMQYSEGGCSLVYSAQIAERLFGKDVEVPEDFDLIREQAKYLAKAFTLLEILAVF